MKSRKVSAFGLGALWCISMARAVAVADAGAVAGRADGGGILQTHFSHHRVVLLLNGSQAVGLQGIGDMAGLSLPDKLQRLSEALSTPQLEQIPFKSEQVWTIAPEMRTVLDAEKARRPPNSIDPSTLLNTFLAHLSSDSIQALGQGNGVPLTSLPQEAQRKIVLALAPPFQVVETGPAHQTLRTVEDVQDPPDWRRVRLRARLRIDPSAVQMKVDGSPYTPIQSDIVPKGLEVRAANGQMWGTAASGSSQAISQLPNKFQSVPSGPSTLRPIALAGVYPLPVIIRQLRKATSLPLYLHRGFEAHQVFIGDGTVSCREVMQCLALALTATWRRLGNAYILAWDENGIRAAQQWAEEAAAYAAHPALSQTEAEGRQPAWALLADSLPFADDDPFALSEEQRTQLFGSGKNLARVIRFRDLTPSQRAFLEKNLLGRAQPRFVNGYLEAGHTINEDDLGSFALKDRASIEVDINLPSVGWVMLPSGLYGSITGAVHLIRDETAKKGKPDVPPQPPPIRSQVQERAVMVPPIPPARLAELFRTLARHNIRTVYYPALYDGYASFPNACFPLDPLYKGRDAWSSATALASRQGVTLIGYVSALRWRGEGNQRHWLDKHPEWADIDVLGRTTLEWRREYPEASVFSWYIANPAGVFVRPTEPEVKRRLSVFLSQFTKQKAAGIALTDWTPPASDDASAYLQHRLGYAPPDRSAILESQGYDPVDVPLLLDPLQAFDLDALGVTRPAAPVQADGKQDPYISLANDLMAQARRARPDWRTIIADDRPLGYAKCLSGNSLNADVVLLGASLPPFQLTPCLLAHLWPSTMTREAMGDKLAGWMPFTIIDSVLAGSPKPLRLVVYDFRSAFSELDDSVRLIPSAPEKSRPYVVSQDASKAR